MKLLNKKTGMVEYDGSRARFPGVEAFHHEEVEAEFTIVFSVDEQRDMVRERIAEKAGDTASLLGTTADAAQFLLYGFASLIARLSEANSVEEVRAAATPFVEVSRGFLERVERGTVKLPFMAKGVNSIVSDIEQRATSVADVLEAASKGEH